jgi:multidrug efflux pump subunit AcrA (membrane-fusion protein)
MSNNDMNIVKRVPIVVWVLVIGLTAIAATIVLRPTPQPRPVKEVHLQEVKVVLANPHTQAVNVNTQGNVEPRRQIDVISQVAGTIVQVSPQFASGGFFAKGSELVQIDPRDYQVALARANAALLEAEKLVAGERGLARQAAREWRDLGNGDANDLFLRKPQLAAAEAQVAAAKAERDHARLNVERTQITLPFAGRVRNTWVDLGQFVGMGTKIATVYDCLLYTSPSPRDH